MFSNKYEGKHIVAAIEQKDLTDIQGEIFGQ